MDWKLDDGRPIWPQLSQQLARRIIAGVYPPGSRLPSVRELATAGRLVTQDAAALEAARLREARTVVRDYFEAMSALGCSRERAIELLKEEIP